MEMQSTLYYILSADFSKMNFKVIENKYNRFILLSVNNIGFQPSVTATFLMILYV